MFSILAHRANLRGPEPARENSWEAIEQAVHAGFGLETDLRRTADGRFYLAHDPIQATAENELTRFSALLRASSMPMAINVKELGYESALVELALSGQLGDHCFYFDFELLEPAQPGRAQRLIRALPQAAPVRLAARLSDRGETLEQCLSIPAEVVWADEFDRLWLTEREVAAVHQAGRQCFVISPELHGFSEAERLQRWADFRAWGVDGICTDFALSAKDFFLP